MKHEEKRTESFTRNEELELLLSEVNSLLASANHELRKESKELHCKLFVMGALRSGTTLFTQWLASTGLVAYPSNLLSRFYGAPLVGAKIQQLLTDEKYNFRNEIFDFNAPIDFLSENGKTRGALAPNEFWYFWRRFLPFGELDYMPDELLLQESGLRDLRDELNALTRIFGKPFMLKGMIMNQNIKSLESLFEKAMFIWVKRDPIYNIQSVLQARNRQYGNINTWYSFKIKEYMELSGLEPVESAAGQVAAINLSLERAFECLPAEKKLMIKYEDFCDSPGDCYQQLLDKLAKHEAENIDAVYNGIGNFRSTNKWVIKEYTQDQANEAYRKMRSRFESTS